MSTNPLNDRRTQAAHLLRRAGFGGTPEEIEEYAALSHADAVDKLLNFKYDGNLAMNLERRLREDGYSPDLGDIAYWWMLTMARTRQPLQEKMTLFWHGHFTTQYSKVRDPLLLLQQNQLFRDYALGNFKELTKKISRDPAMIEYLDGQTNRKGKPNENYARELMELFTLGIGNYSEQDIREAARAFTGWSYQGRSFVFNRNQHDTGTKTFMGQSGNFDGDAIIDIIMTKEAVGRFISTKLWDFFVYPDPEVEIVNRLTKVFFDNNHNIKELIRAIFNSPEFLSEKSYRALVKSPVEYVVGMARQMGITNVDVNLARAANLMGQTLFNPPTVKGWDGELAWINSAYYFERVNTANGLATSRGGNNSFRYNPYEIVADGQPKGAKPDSAESVVDSMINVFLDGQANPEVKLALVEYLGEGKKLTAKDFEDAANVRGQQGRALDVRVRGTLHLIMSTADYMLK
jgi:uncharacterized protein (DUF1800 family)